MTNRALLSDRGRPARTERSEQRVELSFMRDNSHLTVLVAGGTPAVPVKRLSFAGDHSHLTVLVAGGTPAVPVKRLSFAAKEALRH